MTGRISMDQPYSDSSTNLMYNLLFCDIPELYRENTAPRFAHPFNILFADTASATELKAIIDDFGMDPRIRLLAYNKLVAGGSKPEKKELLGVIVEMHMEEGLDTLASFYDGTARYINHTGQTLIWETITDSDARAITNELFTHSTKIVSHIGPWEQPRKPHPQPGNTRITFLVSDGLYFGEAPTSTLFNDKMAGPALMSAANLMQYIIGHS